MGLNNKTSHFAGFCYSSIRNGRQGFRESLYCRVPELFVSRFPRGRLAEGRATGSDRRRSDSCLGSGLTGAAPVRGGLAIARIPPAAAEGCAKLTVCN